MAAGFEKEVRRLLRGAGWSKVRQGSKASHEIWGSPDGTKLKVSVPTKIRSRHTANAILKHAGIGKSV